MRAFPAAYPGRCSVCPEPIRIGDEITLAENRAPMHAECAGVDPQVVGRREPTVCPRCFIAHAGDCF